MVRKPVLDIALAGTHQQLAALNPLSIVGPPPVRGGLPIGITPDAQPVFLDLPRLQQGGYINGTVGLVLGNKGSGKTTLMMKMAGHESALVNPLDGSRRRIAIDDTRENLTESGESVAEYTAMVEQHLGGKHIDLANYQLNILDHQMGMSTQEQYDMMVSLCEVVVNRRLTPTELAAMTVGIEVMNLEHRTVTSPRLLQLILTTLSFEDYETFLSRRRETIIRSVDHWDQRRTRERLERALNCEPKSFGEAAHIVSQILMRLVEGYGGIFGAEHSMHELLAQPVVGINLTRLNRNTIPLVEMVMWSWRAAALGTDFEIHDENWDRWSSIVYGTNMLKHLKHSRKRATRIWRAMHHLSDINQIVGQDERGQAMSALGVTDIALIGRTPRSEHDMLQTVFRPLPKQYLNALPTLGRGQFMVLMGESWPPFFVQVILTERERHITYTDVARDRLIRGHRKEVAGV